MQQIIGSVFISHSCQEPDYSMTEALANQLKELGIDVWWDKEKLEGGQFFPVEILEAIMRQHFFFFIVSSKSVVSKWCLRELIRATELGKTVIPLILDSLPPERMPLEVAGLQYVVISQGIEQAKAKILQALGLGIAANSEVAQDPFARDGRLLRAIADQLTYGKTFTDSLNLVRMLQLLGSSCCETNRARRIFSGMLSRDHYSGTRIDFERVKQFLIGEWTSPD